MTEQPSLAERKLRVGLAAAGCLIAGTVGLFVGTKDSIWVAACLRVGVVLGALWLCLPVQSRSSAWKFLTREKLAVLVMIAVFFHRAKFLIPVLVIFGIIAWVVRPKKRGRH